MDGDQIVMRFVACAGILLAGAAFAGDPQPIPGWRMEAGKCVPDEPWTEGRPRATGLQHAFPEMPSLDSNPMTREKVELGKLLYFDPILSGDNTMSCATCHHPDFGFADGRKLSMGFGGSGIGPDRVGGNALPRSAPTIWNSAYNHLQYWDGRARDLEEQAGIPIKSAAEMNQNPEELIVELRAIPDYVPLFDEAFEESGQDAITFDNVTRAVAAFERTLLSFNSRFDRYTQGDSGALTDAEKRGLAVFRSVKTRCFECHRFPTFADPTFRVLGVPGSAHDPGRAGVPGQGPDGAFKVPTLRNIELTAPYMHNGAFETLEEVIDFYADAGGRSLPNPPDGIDDKIGTFPISDQEKSDLVAFLKSLTDTSLQPEPPTRVPSGLPVVEVKTRAQKAPAPVLLAKQSVEVPQRESWLDRADEIRERERVRVAQNTASASVSATFTVTPDQSIQAAVDRAQPGDRVEVMPGLYRQTVVVDKSGITLVGVVEDGVRAVLDGQGALSDAVQVSGDDFTIEGFTIRHYLGNGVVANKAKNVKFRNLNIHDTGLYGVYPVECYGVLVEGCVVSKISDAGIYVGQSREIIVRNNEVFNSVAGIEIENCVNALVENNSSHHNTAGILVFVLPDNPSKVGEYTKVINNRFVSNNGANFGKPGTIVEALSPGVGIIVMAADHTEIAHNVIQDNGSLGVAVLSLLSAPLPGERTHELDIEPNSDHTWLHDNIFVNNGNAPSEQFKRDFKDVPGVDLFWDGTGERNQWQESNELKQYPEDLVKNNSGAHANVIEFL